MLLTIDVSSDKVCRANLWVATDTQQLAEYMEVRGYADAAQWVYQQGLAPGDWTAGDLVTLTRVVSAAPSPICY